MTDDPRPRIGRRGEALALAHLERLGYRLVARNHRTRWGELDLVVCDERALVFVEVKTRRGSGGPGVSAWDALDERKRRQVRAMAVAFLSGDDARPHTTEVRFDAIGVLLDDAGGLLRLDHLEGAF